MLIQSPSKHIDQELTLLQESLLRMAHLAEEALQKSVRALKENQKSLAEEVIRDDQKINELEVEIENSGVRFIALYQPEASDLRRVISILRMLNDIERIGDLAVNIARASLDLNGMEEDKLMVDLPFLAHRVSKLYLNALQSFIQEDLNLANVTIKEDKEVNKICNQIFKEMLAQMTQNPQKTSTYIQYLLISRHLERIGDHSKNIAELTHFLSEGENIKHRPKEEHQ
jgi:phosphate transport system protein